MTQPAAATPSAAASPTAAAAPFTPAAPAAATSAAATTPTADKGLKAGALHSMMNVVLGVASAAPAYSLAATLGFIALAVGFQSPAIMVLSFLPLFCTGVAMYYLNRADPDCGNTFSWVTKAMGPQLGFFGGWIILAANVLVVSSDAHITGQYTFLLLGWHGAADSQVAVTALGALWVVFLCGITLLGVELSARVQYLRMIGEFGILALFAVVALAKSSSSTRRGRSHPRSAGSTRSPSRAPPRWPAA